LYLLQEDTIPPKYILYLGREVPYEPKAGVETLYIRCCDEYLYWEYIKRVRRVVNKAPRFSKPLKSMVEIKKPPVIQESPYKPVLVKTLFVDHPLDFALFQQDQWKYSRYSLIKDGGEILSDRQYSFLKDNNIELLYVPNSQSDAYWDYLVDNLVDVLSQEAISVDDKVTIIYDLCIEAANRIFTKTVSTQFISRTRTLMNIVVQQIAYHHEFHKLVGRFSDQYSLNSHSANVCIIGMALARTLGIGDVEELTSIAHGLLLHDVGKRMISKSILNKKGMLSSKELAEIRRHPIFGAELMQHYQQVDDIAMDIILHHHEKLDGYGYPHNLIGSQVSTAARIASIADVYDAMTTQRFYQEPFRGFTALKLMQEEMSKELDGSLLEILVRLVSCKQKTSTARIEESVGG
jgi:hypothetical protein